MAVRLQFVCFSSNLLTGATATPEVEYVVQASVIYVTGDAAAWKAQYSSPELTAPVFTVVSPAIVTSIRILYFSLRRSISSRWKPRVVATLQNRTQTQTRTQQFFVTRKAKATQTVLSSYLSTLLVVG